jgi:hypothetical protein
MTVPYPRRHLEARAGAWRGAGVAVLVTGLPALLLGLAVFLWSAPVLPAAIAGALFLYALLAGAASVWDSRRVAIIPYFECEVGEIDTFLAGQALARHVVPLDELAENRGLTPLSAFGYGDDLLGEPVVWHQPAEGISTVEGLLAALETEPSPVADRENVRRDLTRMAHALRRAADREIRFSLLMRHGNATSALEWERRIGTAF